MLVKNTGSYIFCVNDEVLITMVPRCINNNKRSCVPRGYMDQRIIYRSFTHRLSRFFSLVGSTCCTDGIVRFCVCVLFFVVCVSCLVLCVTGCCCFLPRFSSLLFRRLFPFFHSLIPFFSPISLPFFPSAGFLLSLCACACVCVFLFSRYGLFSLFFSS